MENRKSLKGRSFTTSETIEENNTTILDTSWSVSPLFAEKTSGNNNARTNHNKKLREHPTSFGDKDFESESGYYESDSTSSELSKVSYNGSVASVSADEPKVQGASNPINDTLPREDDNVRLRFKRDLTTDILINQSFDALEQELARDLDLSSQSEKFYHWDYNSLKENTPYSSTNDSQTSRVSSEYDSEDSNSSSRPSTVILRREKDRYKVFKLVNSQVYHLVNSGYTEVFDLDSVSSLTDSITEFSDESEDTWDSITTSECTFSLEELTKELDITQEDLPEMRRAGLWITSQYDKTDSFPPETQAQIISSRGTVRGVKNRVRNNIKNLLAVSSGSEKDETDSKESSHPELGMVVIYTTGLRLIRSTNVECHYVKKVFHNLMVHADERDILMNPLYKTELEQRLGTKKYTLPQVFIDGKHVGGAQEIENLVETGQIKEYIQNSLKWNDNNKSSVKCLRCGGYRYITCLRCSGSGKSRRTRISREINQLRCSACRGGLIKCPDCDVSSLVTNGTIHEQKAE